MQNPVPAHPNMGRQIRLKSKANETKRAWLDTEKGETEKMVYVLIEETVGRPLRSTRVLKSNMAELHGPPTSRFQAMLQEKPEIEREIDTLAKKIAKCRVDGTTELKEYVGSKVSSTLAELRASGNTTWTEVLAGNEEEGGRVAAAENLAAAASERAQLEVTQRTRAEDQLRMINDRFAIMEAQLQRAQERRAAAEQELEHYHLREIQDQHEQHDDMSGIASGGVSVNMVGGGTSVNIASGGTSL